ncbi:MAG: hypothetical protein II776_06895 [Clostridia bacterium]|nr:hypothetical protein [Clostridia bacterium]
MSIKDTASEILRRMEEGTAEILSRYRQRAAAGDEAYKTRLADLDRDYRAAAREMIGRNEADLRDRLTGMADLGLAHSGAAAQARISASTALTGSLGQLSGQWNAAREKIRTERDAARAELEREGEEKAREHENALYQLLIKQQNADREYEAARADQAEKTALEKQKLALQRISVSRGSAAKTSSSGKGTSSEAGLELDQAPAKMMDTILQNCRRYNKQGKYYYYDRRSVQRAVKEILEDTRITVAYRYRLYAQARALGYVK